MKKMMKRILPFAVLAGSFALTACQTTTNSSLSSPKPVLNSAFVAVQKIPTLTELKSYDWKLVEAKDSSGKEIADLKIVIDNGSGKLDFSKNPISYSVGCNHISDSYSINNDVLQIKGNAVSTLMSCGNLRVAESMLDNKMRGVNHLRLAFLEDSSAILTQKTSDNSILIWQGTIKPQAKYGKGETLFLQIKPTPKVCDTLTNKQCLEVREITYNQNGIKTGIGNWKTMYEPIDNFKPAPNTQQIIRVNRYRTPPKDTMGYGNVYVFDSVIESEILK